MIGSVCSSKKHGEFCVGRFVNLIIIAGVLSTALQASQPVFSFTGIFADDDSIELFAIDVTAPDTLLDAQTYGFGGGTNGNSEVIPAGGFAPDLFLFDPSGNLDTPANATACPPANTSGGNCFDAALSFNVGSVTGVYTLALTVDPNPPADGSTLAGGFTHPGGSGNFTCDASGGPAGGAFCDEFGIEHDGNWAVDITGAASASEITSSTPEPVSMGLFSAGLAFLALAMKFKRAGNEIQKGSAS